MAKWLLRISILVFLFYYHLSVFASFNFNFPGFYVSSLYIIFGVLLFIGGFINTATLTVVSGLIIFILSTYKIIILFDGNLSNHVIMYLMPASIGFYFFSRGNKG